MHVNVGHGLLERTTVAGSLIFDDYHDSDDLSRSLKEFCVLHYPSSRSFKARKLMNSLFVNFAWYCRYLSGFHPSVFKLSTTRTSIVLSVLLYLHTYIYIYKHIYVYCICVYIHIYMYICINKSIYMYVCIYIYVYTYIHIWVRICPPAKLSIYLSIYLYVHLYILYVCAYTYI